MCVCIYIYIYIYINQCNFAVKMNSIRSKSEPHQLSLDLAQFVHIKLTIFSGLVAYIYIFRLVLSGPHNILLKIWHWYSVSQRWFGGILDATEVPSSFIYTYADLNHLFILYVYIYIYTYMYICMHTYLLTPWSRVLLEKIPSKLCS